MDDRFARDRARSLRRVGAWRAIGSVARLAAAALPLLLAGAVPSNVDAQQPPPETEDFSHRQHADLPCLHCHDSRDGHGELVIDTEAECTACHHGTVVRRECAACHEAGELGGIPYGRSTVLEMSVGTVERSLPFDHADHDGLVCSDCHAGPPALDASGVACADCHEEHHRPEASCRSCHAVAPDRSHDRQVHLTCSGAGCHEPAPVTAAERTRETCLACHRELADHRPGEVCQKCHLLPPARPEGGGE